MDDEDYKWFNAPIITPLCSHEIAASSHQVFVGVLIVDAKMSMH